MTQAMSVHVGLNVVDTTQYVPPPIVLSGCVNDARDLQAVAASRGFLTTTLFDDHATSAAVIDAISLARDKLADGDIFLMTFSGHGSQTADLGGDEDDGLDETWCCYDREVLDDELAALWAGFAPGVRIFFLSDSCHSGTVARQLYRTLADDAREFDKSLDGHRGTTLTVRVPRVRVMGIEASRFNVQANARVLKAAKRAARVRGDIAASLISISGCQDDQLSSDGDANGLFTQTLLEVWDSGSFTGDHRHFADAIIAKMPSDQTPVYLTIGEPSADFEAQVPFTVDASGGSTPTPSTGTPSITGPSSTSRVASPPQFDVDTAGAPFYILEVVTDPSLFDPANEGSRTDSNHYATWSDNSAPNRLTGSTCFLPDDAWARLSAADTIWYRIGTTTSEDSWDGWAVSTGDSDGSSAPSTSVTGDAGGGSTPAPSAGTPSITGPAQASRAASPPQFDVDTAGVPFYILEVVTDPSLTDPANESSRTDSNHYATWSDNSAPNRLTGSTCSLPDDAWARLSVADTIWYRIGTTTSEDSWDGWTVSTDDGDGSVAPSTSITD